MNAEKIAKLKRAIDCLEILDKRPRPMCRDCADEDGTCPTDGLDCDMRKLIADARTILAERTTSPVMDAPDTSQDWAKLDGATAFHLIERHADDWAETGRMMESWLMARMASAVSKAYAVPVACIDALAQEYLSALDDEREIECFLTELRLVESDILAFVELIREHAAAPHAQAPAAPVAEPERFYMDHGQWHDRVTGQHMWTQDQYDEQRRESYALGKNDALLELPDAAQPQPVAEQGELPRALGVSRDAESPGMKTVLVAFERALNDGELRRLHDMLAASQQAAEPVAPPVTPKHIEEIKDLLLWPVTEDDARAARDMLQSLHFDLSMQDAQAPAIQQPQDERAAFEAWAKTPDRWRNGETYDDLHTAVGWSAWQARAALAKKGGAA